MPWVRILAKDKLSFSQDLQSDPTLTDLQKRMISVVATHWDNDRMAAECSLSFIAAGAGTTKKMVNKYALTLAESGRVSIKRAATYTASALWDVNWWFRGSAWVRHTNGGKPTVDCRKESPNAAAVCSDEESPNVAIGGPPVLRGGVPQAGDQFPLKMEIGAQVERALLRARRLRRRKKEKRSRTRRNRDLQSGELFTPSSPAQSRKPLLHICGAARAGSSFSAATSTLMTTARFTKLSTSIAGPTP
jgi:hypothetical protein